MKNKLLKSKMLLAGMLMASFLTDAEAQLRPIQAVTDDKEVNQYNPTGVTNTGTGSLTDRQVMVYDLGDNTSIFAWQYNSSAGNFKLNSGGVAIDPDVVIASIYKTDYALAVFINEEGYIEWESYSWSTPDSSFILYSTCVLGTERNCGNPNVDANATGEVVVTWHQKDITQEVWNISFSNSEIVLGNSEIGLPQSGSFDFISSDIFAAYGYINGSGPSNNSCFCAGAEANVISGASNCKGDQVSPEVIRPMNHNNNGYLYEYNTLPDVAISVKNDQTVVSFTYINGHYVINQVDAEIGSTSEVVYQQEVWNTPFYGPFTAIGLGGTPRIASRKLSDFPYDIEIVSASGRCNDWKIYNWGIFQGSSHAISIVNPDYTKRNSSEPVVTYRGGEDGDDGMYTVAWTSETDFCLDEQNGLDAHARTLLNGVPVPFGSLYHSYVNKGNISSNGLKGDQSIPSISGRLNDKGVNYLFHENYSGVNRMLYKYSSASAGSSQLRTVPNTKNETKTSHFEAEDFGAYPNPFNQGVNFNFTLDKNELGRSISIIDMKGVEIEKIHLPNTHEGVNEVTWEPKRKLSAGIYIAKLYTSEGIRSAEINAMQD